jgi:hypothetical protein
MAGRPTKQTPIICEGILEALRQGNTRTAAAEAVGIHRDTFYGWIEHNPTFSDAIKKAEAYAEQEAVKRITAAMGSTWQAAAWWLERRRPHEWGKADRVDVTIREQAQRLAAEYGLDADDIIREAERIARSRECR